MRIILLCSAFIFCTFSMISSCYYVPTTYPHTAQVVYLNHHTNSVTVKTATGLIYTFGGIEDYMVGDYISLIMDTNGTPDNVVDDVVVQARYSGYTSISTI